MMKNLILKPGAIILWKEHNKLQKFWAKLRKKELEYNRCCIIPRRMDFISLWGSTDNFRVLEPKKQYSSVEKEMLNKELDHGINHISIEDYLSIINIVRPNTLDLSTFTLESLFTNKYYKEVYAEEC